MNDEEKNETTESGEERDITSPPGGKTHEATTPPGQGDLDDEAVREAEEGLGQAGGGH